MLLLYALPQFYYTTTYRTTADESDGTGNPLKPVSKRESRSHSPGERKKRRVSLEGFVKDLDIKVDSCPLVSEAARFLRSDSMTSISSVSSWSSVKSEELFFSEDSELDNDLLPTKKKARSLYYFC